MRIRPARPSPIPSQPCLMLLYFYSVDFIMKSSMTTERRKGKPFSVGLDLPSVENRES